ncbi:hypothetical protein RND71_035422 [Anisodus tanguticus]|uniref:BED-type domain-containing protein n=1 Tax=Anisodus tanguticus TaxID=243964 RepID=A0AAE1R5I0_9SOLA|nr:hypothetical protein RND71_035422 [Anisodus tanguticus]
MDSEQSNNNANATNKSHVASFSPPPVPLLCGVDDLEMDSEGLIEVGVKEKSQSSKLTSKKLTSEAWESFDRVVVKGITRAKCKYCTSLLSYNGANGTSHLLKHSKKTCPGKHLRIGVSGQTQLKVKTEADGSTTLELKEKGKEKKFDQDFSMRELVGMVVIHEYPLSIVDHIGFKRFVRSLNTHFKMISRNTLKSYILKKFNEDKGSLKALLEHNEGRIAITTDMWTVSNQKRGYMAVTSHFIDQQWFLRNRTLRFCFVPCPHTKGVIAKILMDCLSQYSLENKISSIVVDNCTTNDAMMNVLLEKLESRYLMLGGEFLHMRCSAHILNLIVKDGLEVIDPAIEKVRDCILFWMSTPKRVEKFEEACRLLNISKPKRVVLDVKTRWNSTYLMLNTALPFQDVFAKLKRMNKKLKLVIPSENDWMMAKLVCEKLEIFYKATRVFSGRNYPTSNLFFRKVCEIRLALRRWVESDVETIRLMAKNMIDKFDKYWHNINEMLAVASIFDPRNKMDCVEYYFKRLYKDDTDNEVAKVRKNLDKLVVEYQMRSEGNKSQEPFPSGKRGISESCDNDEDEYAQAKRTKKRKMNVRGEVEHYLEDDPIPENDDFDVLNWWKRDQMYPTLQKIAKDILAIPVSSVASESAFSMGGRVISSHRSRLHSKTVEALMCLQNWMIEDIKGTLKGTHACSIVTEDSEEEGEVVDYIDMDVDDVETSDFED